MACKSLGAELEAVVRAYAARASPEGNIPVDENVSRALTGKRCHCDGGNASSAAEPISENQDASPGEGRSSRR